MHIDYMHWVLRRVLACWKAGGAQRLPLLVSITGLLQGSRLAYQGMFFFTFSFARICSVLWFGNKGISNTGVYGFLF